jgi:hypothetical protein
MDELPYPWTTCRKGHVDFAVLWEVDFVFISYRSPWFGFTGSALGLSQMPLLQEIKRINRIAQKKNLLGSTRHSHFCVSPQDEKTRESSRKAFMDVEPCIRLTK